MTWRRRLACGGAWLVPILASVLLAGCGARESKEQVIRFWAMGREAEVVTALVPEFERAHPGIRI